MIEFTKQETTGTHTTGNTILENNQYITTDEITEDIKVIEYDIISGIENPANIEEFVNITFNEILDFIGDAKKIGVKLNLKEFSLKAIFSKDVSKEVLIRRLKRSYVMSVEFNAQTDTININNKSTSISKDM